MSMDQYRDRMKRPLHRMTASRFFWHNFYYPDYMHLLDCRGISAIIYGSILDTLLHRPSVGSNMAARLALLNHMKEQWYNQHPGFIRLPEFTRASLKMADGWCELHGPNVKAANTRQASGLIRHLAWTLCTEDTILDATIREVAASLDSLYQIMHESPMFVSADAQRRFDGHLLVIVVGMQRLRGLSEASGSQRWKISPKVHRVCHLDTYSKSCNPRCVACYADESHVGTMTTIWKKSIAGRHREHSQRTVLCKRWLAILLRIQLGKV